MALSNSYVGPINRIPEVFAQIRDGQAPDRVTQQLLKDWGFTSKNDRAFIPLLKSIGFLTSDGVPTQRYHDYRDHSRSKSVMAEAIREAYGDIFLIKSNPTQADKDTIEGKFKSFHNASDTVAKQQSKTFFGLLALADLDATNSSAQAIDQERVNPESSEPVKTQGKATKVKSSMPTNLHYNIQIHLPATKDIEVYNSIFKSLREHLIEP